MKESDFVRIINNSIKAAGGFSYKISDSPFIPDEKIRCPHCEKYFTKFSKMRFTDKKPFDILSVYSAEWYIEVKYFKGIHGFSEKILSPHQKENLLLVRKNSNRANAVVIIGCYIPRQMKRIYIFDIEFVVNNKITKKMMQDFPFIKIKKTEYMKFSKKLGRKKLVKEDLFDADKMESCIIWKGNKI